MIRYVLHPGEVISKNDGDRHYISAMSLAMLYHVDRRECMINGDGPEPPGAIHLWPRYEGDYEARAKVIIDGLRAAAEMQRWIAEGSGR